MVRDASNSAAPSRRIPALVISGFLGSGKTSLVRAVLGLLPLTTGRVVYAGDALATAVDGQHGLLRVTAGVSRQVAGGGRGLSQGNFVDLVGGKRDGEPVIAY